MLGWKRFGVGAAIVAAIAFGAAACGDDEKGATDGGLRPDGTGGTGGAGTGGTGSIVGTGGTGGVAAGGTGAGGSGAGGTGTGGIAAGGSGGSDNTGGTGGDDPVDPVEGELVIEKVFCKAGATGLDCDEMEVAIPVHVRITTTDATGNEVEVFHGDIEEGSSYREFVSVGKYTVWEACDNLPMGITCRDPSPVVVEVVSGESAEGRLVFDVDGSYNGGGDGTCAPLSVKVTRSCKSRRSWTCSLSNVTVAVSGDANASLTFDRRRTSRSVTVPCGHFDLKATTSRSLYICPTATVSNVANGSTVTFQVSDRKCN